jgi:hypothetical protein
MIKVAIIVGSTRPGRKADAVARWVQELARKRGDAEYELVDVADYDLPLLDEPVPPSLPEPSSEAHSLRGLRVARRPPRSRRDHFARRWARNEKGTLWIALTRPASVSRAPR